MAKGAGMIEPNMATMLAFICTDAVVEQADLQAALGSSVQSSFNAITVDGDESTNDTVLTLANGASGVKFGKGLPGWDEFLAALQRICLTLAKHIVGDGEKITKVVELCVEGAQSDEDAALAARAVANSLLVKSSWYGNDPNWGRVMDALGYSGAEMSEATVNLVYEDVESGESVPVFEKGKVFSELKTTWKKIVVQDKFRIRVNLGVGNGSNTVWSTDLTEGYVNFNMSE